MGPTPLQGTRQDRACDRDHQAGVWLCQGALSRAQQEYPSPARDLRSGQSVYGAPPSIALPTGVICPTASLMVANAADLTPNNATHSYTVTGCGNFNGGYPSQLLVQALPNPVSTFPGEGQFRLRVFSRSRS